MDGNLHALRQYECEQDRLQRLDDWLESIECEIWDDDVLLVEAIREAPQSMPIGDAVENYAKFLMEERNAIRD
jgi:hypothetical protein